MDMLPGIIIFLAALGLMAGEVGKDIVAFKSWNELHDPVFIGNTLIHFGAVVTAFIGGKLIPTDRMNGGQRKTDPKG